MFESDLNTKSNDKPCGDAISARSGLFRFVDLFAGIGGMRLALSHHGGQCVFSSEWDKFSQITYQANYGELPAGDITNILEDEIPDHEILAAGFPCQPFSLAGVSKKNSLGRAHGFGDETQGTLFFEICRIVQHKRPVVLLLENVKNLKSHDDGRTFQTILEHLDFLDYWVYDQVMDGRHYVPQHRERIFLVCFDKRRYPGGTDFTFPKIPEQTPMLEEILLQNVDDKYTLSDRLWTYLQEYARKHKSKGNGFGMSLADRKGISRTLSARYHKDGSEILIPQEGKNPRRLTPRECARLQGFPEDFKIVVSDTQAYRQFGNSVVVPLVTAISGEIMKVVFPKEDPPYCIETIGQS